MLQLQYEAFNNCKSWLFKEVSRNTITAFKKALEYGAEGFEPDRLSTYDVELARVKLNGVIMI